MQHSYQIDLKSDSEVHTKWRKSQVPSVKSFLTKLNTDWIFSESGCTKEVSYEYENVLGTSIHMFLFLEW